MSRYKVTSFIDKSLNDMYRELRNVAVHSIFSILSLSWKLTKVPETSMKELGPKEFIRRLSEKVEVKDSRKIFSYISKNNINVYFLYDQIDKILEYFKERNIKYKAVLSLFEDMEVADWEKLILDIIVLKENGLTQEEIIDLWENLYSKVKFYSEIKEHLVVGVIPGE